MAVRLDVRKVGFINSLNDDSRRPESFAFPACMTSLMEYLGEDVRWQTIHTHNREWTKRKLNDAILAATGMGFGLLWHKELCPSSFDLMQVNQHDSTIKHAFDYMGYNCEILDKAEAGLDKMKSTIIQNIDAGRPVLAFGVVGPPECSILCGYDNGGDTLLGWSHFQSIDPADCENNGMFRTSGWYENICKIVLCGDKKQPKASLKDIVRRGIAITTAKEIDGLYSGELAYNAWAEYIADPAWSAVSDEELRSKFWFHNTLVGNHAEARCYLGGFLRESACDDAELCKIADLYSEIHDTCWQLWGATGGQGNSEAYKSLRDVEKRDNAARLIRKIEELDFSAVQGLKSWLDR